MMRRGTAAIESALLLPVLFVLLLGSIEVARVTLVFFSLQKILYTAARFVGTQQGVNFCDDTDAIVVAAKNYAISGSTDNSGQPYLPNLTAEMIEFRIERLNTESASLDQCDCSITGCDAASGGRSPDFLVVSIPEGYPVRLVIPGLPSDPIPLRPQVRIPFGGT
jgi:hypothetical protein